MIFWISDKINGTTLVLFSNTFIPTNQIQAALEDHPYLLYSMKSDRSVSTKIWSWISAMQVHGHWIIPYSSLTTLSGLVWRVNTSNKYWQIKVTHDFCDKGSVTRTVKKATPELKTILAGICTVHSRSFILCFLSMLLWTYISLESHTEVSNTKYCWITSIIIMAVAAP